MNRKQYSDEIQSRCGKPPDYFNQMEAEDGPVIGVMGFDHYPRRGEFTYFTHGLHSLNRPEWKLGRPEYFICIDREDRSFSCFFAYLISAFAVEKVMGWNTLIGAGDDDAVEGYPYRRIALGPAQYLGWPSYRIDEPGSLPINLGMAYFISDEDFIEASEVGFGYLQQKMEEDHDYWRRLKKR
jgi:hypothetical protein